RRAPLSWLRYGPGRETGRMPGWTDPAKPRARRESGDKSFNRFQEMLPHLLEALSPFPEAREALADAVDKYHWLEEEYGMVPDPAPRGRRTPSRMRPTSTAGGKKIRECPPPPPRSQQNSIRTSTPLSATPQPRRGQLSPSQRWKSSRNQCPNQRRTRNQPTSR